MEYVTSASLSLSLHFSHYLIFWRTHSGHSDWNLFTQEISVCVGIWVCVLVCACDVVIESQEKKITYCHVFVCLRVTGPCHSITGHTNLIIQLWAQWASVYERDGSPGEHRARSVTVLPFCSMTSCVWTDSDSRRLFPRLITVGASGLCFISDTSPAPVGHVCVN